MKKTLYVSRPVIDAQEIYDWYKPYQLFSQVRPENLHTTIAYSRKHVNWDAVEPEEGCCMSCSPKRTIDKFGGSNSTNDV